MDQLRDDTRILSFYSYKGGTGRSMAAANVAWLLAANSYRVLMIDWDLEAPGLPRYFHPFLHEDELAEAPGLVDFVIECKTDAANRAARGGDAAIGKHLNILRYALPVEHEFPSGPRGAGALHLVPAGRPGASYGTRVNTFDWQSFYARHRGREYIDLLGKQLRESTYDYIIIDSRTGVSDTAGICTVQLPDVLAVFFTANSQSVEGASEVAHRVWSYWQEQSSTAKVQQTRRIYPFVTRIERSELDKLDVARSYIRSRFDDLLNEQEVANLEDYWATAETPYVAFYAFEEVLSVFKDRPSDPGSLLGAVERITARLTDGRVNALPRSATVDREQILQRYSRSHTAPAEHENATARRRENRPTALRMGLRKLRAFEMTIGLRGAIIAAVFAGGLLSVSVSIWTKNSENLQARIEIERLLENEKQQRVEAESNAKQLASDAQRLQDELQTRLAELEAKTNLTDEERRRIGSLEAQLESERKAAAAFREAAARAKSQAEQLQRELSKWRIFPRK